MDAELLKLVQEYPGLVSALLLVGTCRMIFKPLQGKVEAYIKSTPTKTDDAKLAKIKSSKTYKVFSWMLDLVASIKLPQAPK